MSEKVWRDITCLDKPLVVAIELALDETVGVGYARERPHRVKSVVDAIRRHCQCPITEEGAKACIVPNLEDLHDKFMGMGEPAEGNRRRFLEVFKKHAKSIIEDYASGKL